MDGEEREALIHRLSTEISTSDLGAFFLAQGLGAAFNRPSKGWGRKKRVTEALLDAESEGRLEQVLEAAAQRFALQHEAGDDDSSGSLVPDDLLRVIHKLELASPAGHVNRRQILDAVDGSESEVGTALEVLEVRGLIRGASVAEERGPVAGIQLTANGLQCVEVPQSDSDPEASYLDYRVTSQPLAPTGGASRRLFTAARGDGDVAEVQFAVTYSLAAQLQTPPEELAETLGWTYVRGLIHLDKIVEGQWLERTADSSWGSHRVEARSDGELKSTLLNALRRMLLSEPRTRAIPSLDVEGVAAVLDENADRIREMLTELELQGLIEPRAQTFGHTLADGACRITAQGLAWLDSADSTDEGRPAPAAAEASATSAPEYVPSEPPRKRVFVSYSHDSQEHKARVLHLADRLRHEGIEADLDQYHPAPPEGWPRWMEAKIAESDFVLVVCTETYYRRVTGSEQEGVGLGSRYEGALISQDIFEAGGRNERFLPVIFNRDDGAFIPPWLRAYTRYDVGGEDGYGELYRRITNQPGVVPPPVGDLIPMPPIRPGVSRQAESVAIPEPLPDWHVDLAILWRENGGSVRRGVSWYPGIGFVPVPDTDRALDGVGVTPVEEDLPMDAAIGVSYLEGKRLRFDFADPARPITARLHHEGSMYEPHGKGGGAEHWIEYSLGRIPDLR